MNGVRIVEPGQQYDGDAAESATLAPYPVADGAPAVLVLPGDGYGGQAADEGEPVARWLNMLGVAAFVLHYRVAPHRYPLPLLDAARGMRLVRRHARRWHVDPARVGVLGFSAGGHLAGLLATETGPMLDGPADEADAEDPRPTLAVLCYPVADLAGPGAHSGSAANLLGPDAGQALRLRLSLASRISPLTPPTFLWHTAEDQAVPVHNTLGVAAALATHRVPHEVHVYPRGQHDLGLAADHPGPAGWTAACARFLREQGWPAREER